MDITQVVAAIPSMNLGNEIGARLMKMSMNQMEIASEGIKKMMELSVNPNIGSNFDVSI